MARPQAPVGAQPVQRAPPGWVTELEFLRESLEEHLVEDVDHRNRNVEVPWLEVVSPKTENLVVAVWNRMVERLSGGIRLARPVLHETPRNSVDT